MPEIRGDFCCSYLPKPWSQIRIVIYQSWSSSDCFRLVYFVCATSSFDFVVKHGLLMPVDFFFPFFKFIQETLVYTWLY